MEKKNYKISLWGCDDATHFSMNLSEDEYQLLSKVSKLSVETSNYGCMPTMEIKEQQEIKSEQ